MKPARIDYQKLTLSESQISPNPFEQFRRWWDEAVAGKIDMIDAVHLSTVDEHNHPDARVVLLKHFDDRGFVFYTNYQSQKAKQLINNPHACLTILWPPLERQVRIRGTAQKTTVKESETYFASRPHDAQVGAWASPQSRPITREELDASFQKFHDTFSGKVPCPPHWGGFRISPTYFEFWQGRENRLHDRICFSLSSENSWHRARLAP